jgi:hypothetical protein
MEVGPKPEFGLSSMSANCRATAFSIALGFKK